MFDSFVPPDSRNWGVMVGSRVGFDSTYDGSCCSDWAEGDIARQHECCGVVFLSLFCISKVMLMQSAYSRDWVVVAEESTIFEESKVLEAEDFGSLFFVLLNFDVITQAHGKEKGKSCELGDGTLHFFAILAMTQAGIAFCCFSFGSSFL